ncbi:MAG TPA: hypothetical protein VNC18_17575 [Gemmatimonadaceae bacterium]|jgi:hypothetical protein|nr:hypothetical protein [Gemmatimonadaceae bacterium]
MSSPFVPSSVPSASGYPLGLVGATAATRYVGATAAAAPASGSFLVGDFVITQSGKVFICTVAGTPGTWTEVGASAGTGLFSGYAQVSHQRAQNTDGGGSTSGSDQTYPITTEDFDTASILSVSSNTITIVAGTYYVDGWATISLPQARARIKLRNTTDGADLLLGRSLYQGSTTQIANYLTVRGRITLAAQKAVELHYQVQASEAGDGLGVSTNFYGAEVYAQVTFFKET